MSKSTYYELGPPGQIRRPTGGHHQASELARPPGLGDFDGWQAAVARLVQQPA